MSESLDNLLAGQEQHDDVPDENYAPAEAFPQYSRIQTCNNTKSRWILFRSVMTIVVFATLVGVVLHDNYSKWRAMILHDEGWGDCGNSTEEAKSKGCIFDFIPGAWVRPDCYDSELEAEFLQLQDWHWYSDHDLQHEISESLIRQTGGPEPVWVEMQYHEQHCAYTWKKLHRAAMKDLPLDSHIGSYAHTLHCSKALAQQVNMTWVSGFFHIYTKCRKVHH